LARCAQDGGWSWQPNGSGAELRLEREMFGALWKAPLPRDSWRSTLKGAAFSLSFRGGAMFNLCPFEPEAIS
jgi:hypothetical protein